MGHRDTQARVHLCATVLKRYSAASPLNIGTGKDVAIAEFARLIAEVVS